MCRRLSIAELRFLQNLYKVNWPKYLPTFALLEQFIERFEEHPEWQEKVIFSTVNEESLKCGTFLMIYCNFIVTFNSLEAAPYTNLEKLLNDLDFSEEKAISFMELHHVSIIEEIVKLQNLEKTFDESSTCFFGDFQQDTMALFVEKFGKPPQGFYYDSLKQCDVPKMSTSSLYKQVQPLWYLENAVKYNVSTGLYTNDGKLVAWIGLHETGQLGFAHVDVSYRRLKLAAGVIATHVEKIFATGKSIFMHAFDKNEILLQLVQFLGNEQNIGSHRWMNLRKARKCTAKSQL